MMYMMTCLHIMRHHFHSAGNRLLMSHEKVIVLIGETCMVVLGFDKDPSKAFLMVPRDTDVKQAAKVATPILHHHFDNPAAFKLTGQLPGAPSTPRSFDKWSLRVCFLIHGTNEYQDVAIIHAKAGNFSRVEILNENDNEVVQTLTTQLCKDFWKDAWNHVVWDKNANGIKEQGMMSTRRTPPPGYNVFQRTYESGYQGVLLVGNKTP